MQPWPGSGASKPEVHTLSQSPYCGTASALKPWVNLKKRTNLNAMFPFRANDIAFINSVVFGTSAKRVIPKNFSSIPDPVRMTSTTSTRISTSREENSQQWLKSTMAWNAPAISAYRNVHDNNTLALVNRLHDGASCPP